MKTTANRVRSRSVPHPAEAAPAATPPPRPLRILFVSSECAPYAKCGGLGDVVASLPKALRSAGADVRTVLPLYASIDRARHALEPAGGLQVPCGNGEINGCGIWRTVAAGGVPTAFVEHDRYFARDGVYADRNGDYGDQAFRFGLLCMAAAELCRARGWIPDVVHVHDWPTAMMPAMLDAWRKTGTSRGFERTGSVLTVHNQAYQGYSHPSVLPYLGLSAPEYYTPDTFESCGALNLLKGGWVYADAVTTVSPTYAAEIRSEPAGAGLSGFVCRRGDTFQGILNGADYDIWDPERDPRIAASYGHNSLIGKILCKRDLQHRLGLALDDAVPVLGMVTRLADQKGLGLLRDVLPWVLGEMHVQLAVLGSGDPAAEDMLRDLQRRYPGRVAAVIGYSEDLSHRIYAGSDFFLMPSLFEPCGLAQMYALRYASLPVVHAVGGLEDTVEQYNEGSGSGTGFKFYAATAQAFHDTVAWAVSTWYDRPTHMTKMRERAMTVRFDWAASAARYLDLYHRVVSWRP